MTDQPVPDQELPPEGEPKPDQTLPSGPGGESGTEGDLTVGNQLPDDPSQDEKNRNKERGRSEEAPGHNKPEPR